MGLPSADFETDRGQIAAIVTNRAPELSPAPTAFAGEMSGALAQITQSIGGDVDQAGRDAVPSVDSSSQGLDNWAVAVGISNGAGGYGRRGATYAQGYSAFLTGQAATAYAAGQQATAAGVTLQLRNPVSIPGTAGTGQVQGTWDASSSSPGNAGTLGNLTAGTVLTLVSPPPTSDSTITLLGGPAVLGADEESDASVLQRIQTKMQRPPNGGNGTDYKDWAEGALDPTGALVSTAQLYAHIYPNYFGDGSPLALVLQAGSGIGRLVPAGVLAAISTYINGTATLEGQRPVGTDCTVLTGSMPPERALIARVRTVPSKAAYAFDWSRGTLPLQVSAAATVGLPAWVTAAGGNAVITLTMLAPVSLKDAISAGAGPRVQLDYRNSATGLVQGPVVPAQWPAVAYLDSLGQTSLALRVPSVANFIDWVGTNSDVYSGGPIVVPVAAAVLASIDGHGPSRASGLADRAQLWDDTVGVTTLSTAAESTLDADGVTRLVSRCIAGGVLVGFAGLSGPLLVQDVSAADNTVDPPEVLRAARILITD